MTGTVTEFDDAKGFGTITADDASTYFVHCTQIADGSRTIAPGTAVTFEIVPWHEGRYEAVAVTPTPPASR
jgi:cold shock CspA family protein